VNEHPALAWEKHMPLRSGIEHSREQSGFAVFIRSLRSDINCNSRSPREGLAAMAKGST
jgi:hypothetical protein